jgi:DNA polymerase
MPSDPLSVLRESAASCRGCDLYRRATQTVFGAGAPRAAIMFIGEQPGHVEDLAGVPFVGLAGRLLDAMLVEAGIDRRICYVTNAVKHFKWEPRGKRRIHKKPSAHEVLACKPWLRGEIEAIQPRVIVCLGATAAQALLGPRFRINEHRGEMLGGTGLAERVLATIHPSAILRISDEAERRAARQQVVEELRQLLWSLREERAQP